MSDIQPARENIDEEFAKFQSALSEAFFFLLGGSINFINDNQRIPYMYEFAGPFAPIAGGEGGKLVLTNNQEIVGIGGTLRETGSSGSSTIDLHYERNGVDQGSIWTTQKLVIPNTTNDLAFFYIDLVTAANNSSAGITLPVFDSVNFDAGDVLRFDIDGNAVSANDLILNLWIRPR